MMFSSSFSERRAGGEFMLIRHRMDSLSGKSRWAPCVLRGVRHGAHEC